MASKSITELQPDLDIVELKPGQVLLIKKPETGKDWLIATFDCVAGAITDTMADWNDPETEEAVFHYDHPEHKENKNKHQADPISGQVTYKLPDWLAKEKGLNEKVCGTVEQETEKAILLKIGREPHTDDVWLPKSQIKEIINPEDQVRF